MITARKSPGLMLRMSRGGLGLRGLGDTPPSAADCSGQNGVAAQYACAQWTVQNAPQFTSYSTQTGAGGQTIYVPNYSAVQGGPPPTGTTHFGGGAPSYAPQLSFTTSRGGNTVQPGDTWQISITGAAPNSPVTVLGIHPDGGSATASYGNTDGSGNFSLSGTFDASMVGNWRETWSVGGQNAGSFSFTVQASGGGGSGSSPGGGATPPPPAGSPGGAAAPAGSFLTRSSFLGLPNWLVLSGVGLGGVFLFSGGGGRRR